MSKQNPSCPTCQGRGWYEGPYYGNLQPSVEMMVCEDCNTVGKPSRAEVVFIGVCFVVFFVLMLMGAAS